MLALKLGAAFDQDKLTCRGLRDNAVGLCEAVDVRECKARLSVKLCSQQLMTRPVRIRERYERMD
jgi:hypothetical protein